MASIMDMFKTKPVEAAKVQEPNKDLSASPPTTGTDGKMPGTDLANQNPLDVYKNMYDNANKSTEVQAPNFSLDPKVLGDVSSKMDFTRGINPEVLQKATSGDVSSLMEIIKTVGQNSYRAALEHGTALTDTHLTQRGEYERKQIDKGVKSQLTSDALSSAPNYSHPVVKAELNRVAAQFAAANPDSSPQEVAKAAQKYINDLQAALNPADPTKKPDGSSKDEMDWTKYLSTSDS